MGIEGWLLCSVVLLCLCCGYQTASSISVILLYAHPLKPILVSVSPECPTEAGREWGFDLHSPQISTYLEAPFLMLPSITTVHGFDDEVLCVAAGACATLCEDQAHARQWLPMWCGDS